MSLKFLLQPLFLIYLFNSATLEVTNNCGSTLYLHRTKSSDEANGGNENKPTRVTALMNGRTVTLNINDWYAKGGLRLYAWWKNPITSKVEPPNNYRDKVEFTWCGTNPTRFCYNPTAVDYIGLPASIGPKNFNDCPNAKPAGSDKKVSQIASECPTKFIRASPFGICLSPRMACEAPYDTSAPLCSALDPIIKQCINDGNCINGITSYNVYGCSGGISQKPKECAAINRGIYDKRNDQRNINTFYKNKPFNIYSAWLHKNKAPVYTQPYDDYPPGIIDLSGYNECITNTMKVVWCPNENNNNNPIKKYIKSTNGLCLDADKKTWNKNGGKVILYKCHGGLNQQWTINGNIIKSSNGKCLDADSNSWNKNPGIMQLWDCNGWNNQKWSINRNLIKSSNGKCLDVHDIDYKSKKNGGKVQLWSCNGWNNQNWIISNQI